MARCSALKSDGTPCERIVSASELYCYSHDPERSDERSRAAAKAGRRGGRGRPGLQQKEISDIKESIREVVNDVLEGRLHTSKGNTVAGLWNVYLRAIEMELAVKEQTELIERLESLEVALEQQEENTRRGA